MIKYKKLKIKNGEEVEELDIDDIEPLEEFEHIHFKNYSLDPFYAIGYSYDENELKTKVAKLTNEVDWVIREYEGKLYLIALKKYR